MGHSNITKSKLKDISNSRYNDPTLNLFSDMIYTTFSNRLINLAVIKFQLLFVTNRSCSKLKTTLNISNYNNHDNMMSKIDSPFQFFCYTLVEYDIAVLYVELYIPVFQMG